MDFALALDRQRRLPAHPGLCIELQAVHTVARRQIGRKQVCDVQSVDLDIGIAMPFGGAEKAVQAGRYVRRAQGRFEARTQVQPAGVAVQHDVDIVQRERRFAGLAVDPQYPSVDHAQVAGKRRWRGRVPGFACDQADAFEVEASGALTYRGQLQPVDSDPQGVGESATQQRHEIEIDTDTVDAQGLGGCADGDAVQFQQRTRAVPARAKSPDCHRRAESLAQRRRDLVAVVGDERRGETHRERQQPPADQQPGQQSRDDAQ